jgi:2-(1,2-epoxy-1,2-dihydrophenyl)acetyl-CoA isomerase
VANVPDGELVDTPLKYQRDGRVATLTLNAPNTRNALSGDRMFAAFEHAVDVANRDLDVGAVILTGAGPAFCSGGNVLEMRDKTGMFAGPPEQVVRQYQAGIQRVTRAIARLEAPLIAAVNGPAVGAGCDLACMCDIRIASDRATFAHSFVRLGIISGDGGSWFLPRIVGWSRAAEMAFTGDTLDASSASMWGLVSRVVPADSLMVEARALADRIAANPTQAVRWAKRLLREAHHGTLDTILELSAAYQALAHGTEEHLEAVRMLISDRRRPG